MANCERANSTEWCTLEDVQSRSIACLVLTSLAMVACGTADTIVPFGSGSSGATPGGGASSSGSSGAVVEPDGGRIEPDAGAPPDPNFLVHQDNVFVGSVGQPILVMEPRRPTAPRLPIVIAYHGDGSSAVAFRDEWRLHETSAQGALVVYPDDSGNASAWGGAAMRVDHPLAEGFGKIVQRMVTAYHGDATRVFVAGMSSGGIFAGLMACKYSGSPAFTLRAAITMSGSAPNPTQVDQAWPVSGFPRCEGEKPITTLVIHGKADQTEGVSYHEGQWASDYWTYVNRVGGSPPFADAQINYDDAAPSTPFPGFDPACRKYDESPPQHPVVLCSIEGMGHQLWQNSASTVWQFANYATP